MSEENTPETVAWEYQVINYRDITKNPVEAVGEDMHNSPHKLIRLSSHKRRMKEQREEVLELIEEEIENWKSNLQYDDDRRFNEGCVVALQDLKQKLKGEDDGD